MSTLPPPMFEVEAAAPEPAGVPPQQLHCLNPDDLRGTPYCAAALYGSIVGSAGVRTWVWHVCTQTGEHQQHTCDRCEVTW